MMLKSGSCHLNVKFMPGIPTDTSQVMIKFGVPTMIGSPPLDLKLNVTSTKENTRVVGTDILCIIILTGRYGYNITVSAR